MIIEESNKLKITYTSLKYNEKPDPEETPVFDDVQSFLMKNEFIPDNLHIVRRMGWDGTESTDTYSIYIDYYNLNFENNLEFAKLYLNILSDFSNHVGIDIKDKYSEYFV